MKSCRAGKKAKLLGAVVLLTAIALLVAACSGAPGLSSGNDGRPTRAVNAVPPSERAPNRDLAVISVDFDPPLRLISPNTSPSEVSLLVAVDNKGKLPERHVVVNAVLRSQPADELLVNRQVVVPHLAPGQAEVVRFAGFPSIPIRSGYLVTVTLEPVPGEEVLFNNTMTMPLQIVMSR